MTREEVIMELKQFSGTTQLKLSANFWTALNMAIKALEQEPSEDCVSRSDVIKVLNNHWLSGSCSRRIIDEQIDKVKALPSVSPTTCIAKVTFSKDDLQELVDEKVKELAQRMESRWIPVSERLPEENGGYLVTVNQRYITTALWWGIPKYWDNVIAWMPLPEPYKAEMESEE